MWTSSCCWNCSRSSLLQVFTQEMNQLSGCHWIDSCLGAESWEGWWHHKSQLYISEIPRLSPHVRDSADYPEPLKSANLQRRFMLPGLTLNLVANSPPSAADHVAHVKWLFPCPCCPPWTYRQPCRPHRSQKGSSGLPLCLHISLSCLAE